MARPILKRPSKGKAVNDLQDLLNRIGSLLAVDGDFGSGTERAVKEAQDLAGLPVTGIADPETWAWLEAQPVPSPDLSTSDVTFVVLQEVGGREYYDRVTMFPHFPGGGSGVTIGIGYDLRYQGAGNLQSDWIEELGAEDLDKLRPYVGVKGSQEAVEALRSIQVPFQAAWMVFTKRTLPRYINETRSAYPQLDLLPDGCRGALVSLVYNRGTDMAGDSRSEMKTIQSCLIENRLARVADEIEAMKRLWPGSRGLRERREREADLWRKGLREAGLA